jgi:hypothetical protein
MRFKEQKYFTFPPILTVAEGALAISRFFGFGRSAYPYVRMKHFRVKINDLQAFPLSFGALERLLEDDAAGFLTVPHPALAVR